MTNEEYVRAKWLDGIGTGLWLYEAKRSYHLNLGDKEIKGTVSDKEAVWQRAYDFTVTRVEEIRQLDIEISVVLEGVKEAYENPADADKYGKPLSRTLGRLQSIRADLVRGMRL